ncbi:TPA: hypothetical protein I7679_01985 [Vibrio vulnificus]|nr:hypothetical protein CRN51_05730 [Vibrio vulnificus]HAS8166820.1 hypothetical protein [Vibrio vulnificus]HAS8260279.1 hypothetical protein [Vibrio vulnificus]
MQKAHSHIRNKHASKKSHPKKCHSKNDERKPIKKTDKKAPPIEEGLLITFIHLMMIKQSV